MVRYCYLQQLFLFFLTAKLEYLRILPVFKAVIGDAGARFELYQKCLETFLKTIFLDCLAVI